LKQRLNNGVQNALVFAKVFGSLVKTALRGRPRLTIAILAADAFAVMCRVGAVLVLSLIAVAAGNEGVIRPMGVDIALPPDVLTLGLIAAGAIGGLFFVSALMQWVAVWLARRLARWMTERQITRVLEGIKSDMATLLSLPVASSSGPNFNRMLTQNAIHVGMMTETAMRMANPVLLFGLAWIVVVWQSPILGLGIVVFAGLFLPVFVAQFIKTQRTANAFYADDATVMGQDVSRMVNRITTQVGVYGKDVPTSAFPGNTPMHVFLNGLDSNILANERIGLLVGLIGALFIGFVVAVNAWLAETGQVDIAGIVAIAGSFIYLIAAARNVASQLTNQVRFFPQVRNILAFTGPALSGHRETKDVGSVLAERLVFNAATPGLSANEASLELLRGEAMIVSAPVGNDVFSALETIRALLGAAASREGSGPVENLVTHIGFLSDYYRFQPDTTVVENLTGGRPEVMERALAIIADMGVAEEFDALSHGLGTVVTEAVYAKLTGTARTALRLVPVLALETPRLLIINVGAVRNLNPRLLERIFDWAPESYRIFLTRDTNVPPALGENFAVLGAGGISRFGDRSLLSTVMGTDIAEADGDIGTAIL